MKNHGSFPEITSVTLPNNEPYSCQSELVKEEVYFTFHPENLLSLARKKTRNVEFS